MTSTTPTVLSAEARKQIEDALNVGYQYAGEHSATRAHQITRALSILARLPAVESLALERIAVPEGQAELSDDEIMELTRAECEFFRWPSSALAIARAILSARKDRADALLREAAEALETHLGGTSTRDPNDTLAAIRTYLKGEAP